MPFRIHNATGEIYFTSAAWQRLLQLATTYGWEPAGTLAVEGLFEATNQIRKPHSQDNWSGDYSTPTGQLVSAQDTLELTRALARALPDIPDHDTKDPLRDRVGYRLKNEDIARLSTLDWFSGSGKNRLKEFIRLCNWGGFIIS